MSVLAGVFPIAPTPSTEAGDLDLINYENRQGGLRATKAVMNVVYDKRHLPPACSVGALFTARRMRPKT